MRKIEGNGSEPKRHLDTRTQQRHTLAPPNRTTRTVYQMSRFSYSSNTCAGSGCKKISFRVSFHKRRRCLFCFVLVVVPPVNDDDNDGCCVVAMSNSFKTRCFLEGGGGDKSTKDGDPFCVPPRPWRWWRLEASVTSSSVVPTAARSWASALSWSLMIGRGGGGGVILCRSLCCSYLLACSFFASISSSRLCCVFR